MRNSRGVGAQRLGVGVCRGQSVQGGRSQSPHHRFRTRHGLGTARPHGWQTAGSGGGWVALHGGAQLAIDTTMVSPLHRDGSVRRGAAAHDGAALRQARTRKERTYPELAGEGGRAGLVVLAAEVGGRWSEETVEFLSSLAWAKVRELPEDLQRDGRRSWLRRWKKLLGCTAAKAFAMSLLDLAPSGSDGAIPSVREVICEARHS